MSSNKAKWSAEFLGTFWLTLGAAAVPFWRLRFPVWVSGCWVCLWPLV